MQIPYNWDPEPHQLKVLENSARFKIIIWHRKAHKSTMAINELLRWAYTVPGIYWYVAPFYGEAKETIWMEPNMLPKFCPPDIWAKRNNSELYIPFPNGSVLYLKGADNVDSLRGPNPRGVILDEFATMKKEIWTAIIQPIMMANPKGWTWFVGTPKGRNHFYERLQYAKNNNDPEWFYSILKASESGIIAKEQLQMARKTTTQAYFNQEYECEFAENAGQFFKRIKENITDKEPDDVDWNIGVDLAKYNDYTVITPFGLNSFIAGKQDRFNQIDYNLQKAKIESVYHRLNKNSDKVKVIIDSTGVGEPVFDDLNTRIKVEPYRFSESTRMLLLRNLQLLLEQDKIKIQRDEGLIEELEAFTYSLTETGKTKVTVPDGMHDDRVMSLALAVWGITDKIEPSRIHAYDKVSQQYMDSLRERPMGPSIDSMFSDPMIF